MLNLADTAVRFQTAFYDDVIRGLAKRHKSIPCRWLYDERGSELFEMITLLEDYYPTRLETGILRENALEIASFAAGTVALLEYGAGAGVKTEILLEALAPPIYVPIDICGSYLEQTAARLGRLFPQIQTRPVIADFSEPFSLPPAAFYGVTRMAFFPGSTIGNLSVREASRFLRKVRSHTGPSGRAIIGVDLKKDLGRLTRAYQDSQGITAAFNLNLLERMNRELAADFDIDDFVHEARWNDAESAVEMHLVSRTEQDVAIDDQLFTFQAGETIHTESSRKYDVCGFTALAQVNGWHVCRVWQDPARDFAVFGLVTA